MRRKISKSKLKRMEQSLNRQMHERFERQNKELLHSDNKASDTPDFSVKVMQDDLKKFKDVKVKSDESSADNKTLIDDFDSQLSSNEPIRELFTPKNIKFKTQVTEEQRGAISILYHAYELASSYGINFNGLKFVLDQYVDFGVSVERKGRSEYVDAHKANVTQSQQQQGQGMSQQISQMKM